MTKGKEEVTEYAIANRQFQKLGNQRPAGRKAPNNPLVNPTNMPAGVNQQQQQQQNRAFVSDPERQGPVNMMRRTVTAVGGSAVAVTNSTPRHVPEFFSKRD